MLILLSVLGDLVKIFTRLLPRAELVIEESVLFSIQLVLVLSALPALGVLVKNKVLGKFSIFSYAIYLCMIHASIPIEKKSKKAKEFDFH